MSVTTGGSGRTTTDLRAGIEPALRTLATVTIIGVGCGVFVVGVLSRLAMSLLIQLNPEAAGLTSDDGFVMGQVTLSGSLNLAVIVGPLFGILGAGFYLAFRGLMIGPRWFRLLSFSVGPAVVVAAMVVHPTGVDFRELEPLWLAVALFVLIPAVYVVLLVLLVERALAGPPWPKLAVYLGVACWGPLLPGFLLLALGWAVLTWLRGFPAGAALLARPVLPWVARGALAVVFLVAVAGLASDIRALT